MIKILIKVAKAIGIGVGTFILIYLVGTFTTRDISHLSCMLTFGNYKQKMICEQRCENIENKFICTGGFFDIKSERKSKYYPIEEMKKKEKKADEKAYYIKYFCGNSGGFGGTPCEINEDCVTGGCNGEICTNRDTKTPGTACMFQSCFSTGGYINCKCVNKRCGWTADDKTIIR